MEHLIGFNVKEFFIRLLGLFDIGREEAFSMKICELHRDRLGICWRGRGRKCQIPEEFAWHKQIASEEKGRALQKNQSEYILKVTGKLIPIGAG